MQSDSRPSQFDLPSRSQQRATRWQRWILKIGPTLEMNSNSNRWAELGAATPLWLLAGQCLQQLLEVQTSFLAPANDLPLSVYCA